MIVDVAMLGRAVDDDVEIARRGAWPSRSSMIPPSSSSSSEYLGFMSAAALKSPGMQRLERRVDVAAVDQQLAHVADIEQAGIFAGPQMLGHDAFILDRHLIAGERHHPPALRAMPRVERQLAELGARCRRRLPDRRYRACPAPGSRRSDRCGLPCSSSAPDRCDGRAALPSARLPPPSVAAPESFAPSAAPLRRPEARRTLSRLSGARGPWCLRDSGGGCSFGAVLAKR